MGIAPFLFYPFSSLSTYKFPTNNDKYLPINKPERISFLTISDLDFGKKNISFVNIKRPTYLRHLHCLLFIVIKEHTQSKQLPQSHISRYAQLFYLPTFPFYCPVASFFFRLFYLLSSFIDITSRFNQFHSQ